MARRIWEQEMLASDSLCLNTPESTSNLQVIKEIKLHKSFGGVFAMQLNYNGTLLAVGYGAGGVQVFNTETGNMTIELRACRQGGFSIMALRFHPKLPNVLYASSAEGHIYIFDVITGELKHDVEEHGNEINTMDFSVDGYNFSTGGKDLNVRVYDTKSNTLVKTYEGNDARKPSASHNILANTMRVFSIKYHPNNQFIFISGGWDNHLKIWDIRDNTGIKRNIRGPHICGDALDMRNNKMLTGQWTALHALQEIDYTTGKNVREIAFPHKDGAFLYACQYVNDKTVIAGGSGTNAAEVIEIETNKHIGGYKLGGCVHTVDSAMNGKVVAVGGAAPIFAILSLDLEG